MDSGNEVGPIDNLKLTTKTVRTHHLPDFIHKDNCWVTKFLPTVYYWLFVSNALFDEFTLSSPELPGIIQELIQLIYGKDASKYIVQGKHDPILLMVCTHPSAENLLTSVTRFIIDATTYAT